MTKKAAKEAVALTARQSTDWDKAIGSGLPPIVYHHLCLKGEAFLAGLFKSLLFSERPESHIFDGKVPEIIHWQQEFSLPGSRIDYLLTHADGSITVCELKDGGLGKQSVLAGIGQAIGYAIQVGASNAGISKVRKALVFTALPSAEDEIVVIDACIAASVIPVPMGSEAAHRRSLMDFIERKVNG